MAKRSIRDWIRRKSRGRTTMTSDMRELIDSFDAHKPSARRADDMAGGDNERAREATEGPDRPSDAVSSGTQA
jgi:hypothetical protein